MNDDLTFWLGYITNGKHLTWYASFQFTIFAAVFGGLLAVAFGLLGVGAAWAGAPRVTEAATKSARPWRSMGGLS